MACNHTGCSSGIGCTHSDFHNICTSCIQQNVTISTIGVNILIVFEGIDGCGKETQINLLRQKFVFEYFKYPTQNFGILNDYLEKKIKLSSKSLFHLFLADIANEQEKLGMAIASGHENPKITVVDRYVFSTIAYEIDGINYENAKKIVNASGFLKPNLVVYMDITPTIAQERKRKQKQLDRYEENKLYLTQVRANYLKLYQDKFFADNWHLVDSNQTIEEVHLQILKILTLAIQKSITLPVGRLG